MRAARGLPYIELALFHGRHFDLYGGETYERAVRTEVRFFRHHFDKSKAERAASRAAAPPPTQPVGEP